MTEQFNHPFEPSFAVRTRSRGASTLRRCDRFRPVRDETICMTARIGRFAKTAALIFAPWGLTKERAEGTIQQLRNQRRH